MKTADATRQTDDEKRAYPRISVFRPLVYQSDDDPETRVAFTRDLSIGGIGMESTAYPYTQERLSLWLPVHPRVIQCRGRVVRVELLGERFCAGITFESMSAEDRAFLTQYLISRLKEKSHH